MENQKFNIVGELEFNVNTQQLRNVNLEIKALSTQISAVSKNISNIRTGALTDINEKIRLQLAAINPLNNALQTYNKLSSQKRKSDDGDGFFTDKDEAALKNAEKTLMDMTGKQKPWTAAAEAKSDIFIGRQQLAAFRQSKSEIIVGLQKIISEKNKLITNRGELQIKKDRIADTIKVSQIEQQASVDALKLQENRARQFQKMQSDEFKSIRERLSMQGKDNIKQEKIDIRTRDIETAKRLMDKTGLSASNLAMSLKRMGLQIKGGKIMAPFNKEMKMTDKLLKDLKKNAVRFNMSLLSVMFAGMALQRASSRAFRSLVTTYQKANEETEGLGKATWHLNAAWEFFKYSLMDALLQSDLFKMLVTGLVQFVQWLNKLPQGAKTFIIIAIAALWLLGTLMLVVGQIGLFINGLTAMGIGQSIIAALGASFWWVAAIFLAVIMLWTTNFAGFRDFVKQQLGIILLVWKTVFGHIWNIIKLVFKLIMALWKGDFDEAYKIAYDLLKQLLALFTKIFIGIAVVMINALKFAWNMIADGMQLALNTAIGGINLLIRAINRIPGVSIPLIPSVDLSAIKAAYTTMEQVKSSFDWIDNKLGITKAIEESAPSTLLGKKENASTSVDNSTNTFNFEINASEGMNISELADKVMQEFNDKYSMNVGSNNG
jgi:hypothetical protein